MTKAAKIRWAAVFLASGTTLVAGGVAVYFLVNFVQGNQLAGEGYAAMRTGEYDKAITRFDAALKKPLGDY